MQCYTELLPPSGVTHVLSVPFLSATSNNLIVAKTSLLQIFSLVNVPYGAAPSQTDTKARQERPQHTKLVLVAEYDLPGTIVGLGRVKSPESRSGGETVLVATRNAKLSIIEWDPEKYGITTTSIHYYERQDDVSNPWYPDLDTCPSRLTVDPSSRCAILYYGMRNLAILPFPQQGDDLVMDDYDPDLDGERPEGEVNSVKATANGTAHTTPYMPSFVLPLTALDPSLLHPIVLEFLHEYREPTFGILYSQVATSSSLLHERKDVVFYAVFTLDLQQRASTTLLSVPRLPSDLFKLVPLPPPVGGALLIGSNELVHVDQGGKTNAVGVNEFARQASAFSMADQSDLEMRLEGCVVEQLGTENGDLVLALTDGRMAVVSFRLDGRSVSGISVRWVSEQAGGLLLKARPTCTASLGQGKFFLGSEEGDSLLLGWSRPSTSAKKSQGTSDSIDGIYEAEEDEDEALEDDDDMYDDDLYSTPVVADAKISTLAAINGEGSNEYIFRPHDRLWNLGLMRDVTLGRPLGQPSKDGERKSNAVSPPLELIATQGSGRAGGLAILRKELDPHVLDSLKLDGADGVWSVQVRDPKTKHTTGFQQPRIFDRYLILAKSKDSEKEESVVYSVADKGLEEFKATEFNTNEDFTIDIGTMAGGTKVVQVLRSEVRSYEHDLGLAQIYPVYDEDTEEERTVLRASFAEPYLLIIKDDQSLLLLEADESGDLDEVSVSKTITACSWLSGSLYVDKSNTFTQSQSENDKPNVILFLLDTDHRLLAFHLPDTTRPIFALEGVDFLPPILSSEPPPKRQVYREMISELLVADLGDYINRTPYIILRTMDDDLVAYEPYRVPNPTGESEIKFSKAANHFVNRPIIDADEVMDAGNSPQLQLRPLRALEDVCGYRTVFMPGTTPCFIIKSATSRPHVLGLRGKAVHNLTALHTRSCERGFAYVDTENVIRMCRFPANTRFDNLWSTRKVFLGEEVDCIEYSAPSETYVLGTSQLVDFKLPDDNEIHPEWQNEAISFMPQLERGSVKLLNPKTWSIIDSVPLAPAERITSMKTISIEVSEITHERKDLTVVGTAIVKGEDINPRGCIYMFEVIDVVPDPEKPEMDRKLKLVAKEELKGCVTALSGIGGQGFLIVAQGQKCMVRGLKEDGSLLPVAFMDMQCYTNVLKELKGTGMCIIGDALKGLWFTGYSEEPYKLTLFGKDNGKLPLMAADFLPDGRRLYIIAADDDCNLRVMEYDPEDPASSKGDRLLQRSVFHTGHFTSNVLVLPRADPPSDSDHDEMDTGSPTGYQVLVTSQDGSIAVIKPMVEESYRRLSALQSQLVNSLEHPCGLNPRMYRAVESDGIGGRGMLDGNLLQRWLDLSTQRKADIASRVGADVWEVRNDLEGLGMTGLGYF